MNPPANSKIIPKFIRNPALGLKKCLAVLHALFSYGLSRNTDVVQKVVESKLLRTKQ